MIELITKRDNIKNILWEENKEVRKSLAERDQTNNELGLVITHLEEKLESQRDAGLEEALNQGVKETRNEEQKQLTKQYKQTAEEEIRKSCTLEIKNIELNKEMEKMRHNLKEKEESNDQLLLELIAQQEDEHLLKLDHTRNQETHYEEITVKIIRSMTDRIFKNNQEELEAERISQNNIMKQILEHRGP